MPKRPAVLLHGEPDDGLAVVPFTPLTPPRLREGVDDPALLGFPATLPIELAMGEYPRNDILTAYGITPELWDVLRFNPTFRKAITDAQTLLRKDGMSFRLKARMQAEALLETSWNIIHSLHTPAAVKADLIKHTHRVAGYEPKSNDPVLGGTALQINLHLG
jgi:hypothetical protein